MPEKLTDSEIVKALEEVLKLMLNDGDLQRASTISKTLDLINRLQAENERLKEVNDGFTCIGKFYSEIKAEAYKEFAERLKPEFKNLISCNEGFVYHIIDNLLKELVVIQPPLNDVKCKDCEYLEFELPYAVCSKAYKGIVAPDDSCGKGKLKELGGE